MFPGGVRHDTFEHPHIVVTPLAAGGWEFSLRAPDRLLSDDSEPYTLPVDELAPWLFDDELPDALCTVAVRHFGSA